MENIYDPNVVLGDTLRWSMAIKNSAGSSYDLTGSTLSMQIRSGYYPSSVLVSYTTGITTGTTISVPEGSTGGLAAATGGSINICVGSNYTKNFPPYTQIFYDLQQVTSGGDTITLLRGKINTILDVTRT
jgi:hypothetical protein